MSKRPLVRRNSPRRLIWLVLHGWKQKLLAQSCIESIRLAGGYRGDICLFTDQDVELDVVCDQVRIPATSDWQEMCAARISCGLQIDFESYDELMYMDVDHLCTMPIDPAFSDMSFLRAMVEPKNRLGGHSPANGLLTPEERQDASGSPVVCAGLFAASTTVMRESLILWKSLQAIPSESKFRDQHGLNALIYRGLIPFKRYSWGVVCPVTEERFRGVHCVLRHYWATSKRWMVEDWQQWKAKKFVGSGREKQGLALRDGEGEAWRQHALPSEGQDAVRQEHS